MKFSLRSWLSQLLGRSIEVTASCTARTERIGTAYGGWTFCPDFLDSSSTVYCAGIGDDLSFDLGLIERFGCEVHGLDPTPKCREWLNRQQLSKQFHHLSTALAGHDGTLTLYPLETSESMNHSMVNSPGMTDHAVVVECLTIPSLMARLGHSKLDLLKIDIEGSEYEVIPQMLQRGIVPTQLLVEFHHRFPGIGVPKTKAILKLLANHGYSILAATAGAREVTFIQSSRLQKPVSIH